MSDKAGRKDYGFFKKGCLFQTAFAIVFVYTVLWLILGINTVNISPFALASAIVPLGGLILSLYKQHIGGLLIIFSGFLPIILLANTPKDDFYNLGMAIFTIFVTLPLCFAGGIIAVAPSKKPLEPLKRDRKYMKPPKKGKKETVARKCKACGSEVSAGENICPNCMVLN